MPYIERLHLEFKENKNELIITLPDVESGFYHINDPHLRLLKESLIPEILKNESIKKVILKTPAPKHLTIHEMSLIQLIAQELKRNKLVLIDMNR